MKLIGFIIAAVIVSPAAPPCPHATQTQGQPPADCSASEHHQFDFWVGDWTVTVQGKPAGTNRIEASLKGCVLVESWTATGGGKGTSLNFYDRNTRRWHQTWIDDRGGVLQMQGGVVNGAMVMRTAALPQPGGGTVIHRITWSPQDGGRVRQHWESSTDDGKTWTSAFDGMYAKVSASR